MYNRHTTTKQSAEIVEESLSGEQSGTTPSTSMNTPTQRDGISTDKSTNNISNTCGTIKYTIG